jgi:alkanesulfonate monooxygenase SsuD/methylene tetrahydromethanopterin reductase-like flavin-dependent oxidoreductase (luciferase family)
VIGALPNRDGAGRWPAGVCDHESRFHEPTVLFGHLAAIARRVGLTIGVIVPPQRQTVLAAKQLAEIDVVSGGRLRVGIGLWVGTTSRTRRWGPTFETVLGGWSSRSRSCGARGASQWWTSKAATTRFRAPGISPLPVQRPLSVWLGGSADLVLRRVARLADGWLSSADAFSPALEPMLATLRRHLSVVGRDAGAFPVEGRVVLPGRRADDSRRGLERRCNLGATQVAVNTLRGGLELERQLELVAQFETAVAA